MTHLIRRSSRNFQQVTDSLHDKAKRKSHPTGLGIGLPTERRKTQPKSATGATANEEGHVLRDVVKNSVGLEKVTGLKEDNEKEIKKDEMRDACGKGANVEGQEVYKTRRIVRSRSESEASCGKASDNNEKQNAVQETTKAGEVNTPNLKTIHLPEPNYRFKSRKEASSYLSISRTDYQSLVSGRSLSYINSSSGCLVTIRMVSKGKEQAHGGGERELEGGARLGLVGNKMREEIEGTTSVMVDVPSEKCGEEEVNDTEGVDAKEKIQAKGQSWTSQDSIHAAPYFRS